MNNWSQHDISFNGHFIRAMNLLSNSLSQNGLCNPSILYYAALELRIAIERVLWELMALPKVSEGRSTELSKSDVKLYKPKEIWQNIVAQDPLVEKRLAFTRILFEVDPTTLEHTSQVIPEPNCEPPNVPKLDELYGRIGSYLHAIEKRKHFINDSEYWNRFHSLLEETLSELDRTARGRIHLSPTGQAEVAFKMFVSGSSMDEVKSFLRSTISNKSNDKA